MCPTNIAEHYARLQQTYEEYGICIGAQIFNLDESGISTKTAYRARVTGVWRRAGVKLRLNLSDIQMPIM